MSTRRGGSLVLPAVAVVAALLVAPLLMVGDESLRLFVPGRVGSAHDAPLTFQNYAQLIHPAYARYFADTFRISFIATLLALLLAYPIGYRVAREARPRVRRAWISFLVVMLFLSILIRVYAVSLAVQALNPTLVEAAQALGAPVWKAHVTITLPLSARGVLAAFMLCFTFSISAFVIPMVLGKGRVLFVSNLIYSRFGEIGNYPGGAALSIALLVLSLIVVYVLGRAAGSRWET